VWSASLVRRLADRQLGLRTDVVYATFRGAVREHVPVARGASAASFARFVAQYAGPYALCLMPYALCLSRLLRKVRGSRMAAESAELHKA
jgi:hypothetical protein